MKIPKLKQKGLNDRPAIAMYCEYVLTLTTAGRAISGKAIECACTEKNSRSNSNM